MTKPLDPYSRVYWRVLNDERFDEIRSDMRHFGSWTLMLIVADMAYPAPAFVPSTVPRASLRKLVDSGLIETLKGGLYHVHGLKAERDRRSPSGPRPEPTGTPAGAEAVPTGTLARAGIDETRRDETRDSRDEQTAREFIEDRTEEVDLFAFLAQHGAFIRPDSGFGVRLLGLIDRRGAEAVQEKAKAMLTDEPMSDRQWVFGLEKALEAIPSPPMDELPTGPDPKSQRIYDRMVERRLEYLRETGKWLDEWGPQPTGAAA